MSRSNEFNDQEFIAQAMPAFVTEAHEQVAEMENLLLQLELQPSDRDMLDALFRCAHTVKGSAGIFGLTGVVEFTHHIETLLDLLREGRMVLSPELGSLLLECNDQILALVNEAQSGEPDLQAEAMREALVLRMSECLPTGDAAERVSHQKSAVNSPAASAGQGAAAVEGLWHLSATFGTDCFRHGMDPLSVLSYLGEQVQVVAVACDRSTLPQTAELDPESCHLLVQVAIRAVDPQGAVDNAFSFIREDCALRLIPPQSPVSTFLLLLEELPDHPRLGEMLVQVGAISNAQLHEGLEQQRRDRSPLSKQEPQLLGAILHEQSGVSPALVDAAVQKQKRRDGHADDGRFLHIPADRLDAVIDLLGELVVASASSDMLARQSRQVALVESQQRVMALIENIRNVTLQMRMVPIGGTFSRFRRVVRDTASELGKEVVLTIEGGDTELDKAVVEKIADPLMHLVRNGLDHGLETPAERLAAGKPAEGKLLLSARHESGSIVLNIQDDGRGIHRQKVLARAWERGLVEPGVVPPDHVILNMIFEPGFSTAEQVTNLSGRGVGMDVVRQNIEALRGSVAISSVQGQGTSIEICLPLTLAIIDGFLVGVDQSRFVLASESVIEVVDATSKGASLAQDALSDNGARGFYCMSLRDEILPVVCLRRLYELPSAPPARVSVVVVQAGQQRFGIEVDQLLGYHQTVIKPLSRLFSGLRGLSGSSVLGNGEVALILDVNALRQVAGDAVSTSSSVSTSRTH